MGPAVTGSRDPLYDVAYVDVDEWRHDTAPIPLRPRRLRGTDARFSFYFPVPQRYEGRFFHPLMPISGTEHWRPR